tara:strand:- start:294 stop:419 length:126 start_codon:yes stop_codon:yes gene_type:complete
MSIFADKLVVLDENTTFELNVRQIALKRKVAIRQAKILKIA